MAGGGIMWRRHEDRDALVLIPHGSLDPAGYRAFRDDLVRFAVDQPRALIVVLDQLRFTSGDSLTAFASARQRVSEWPCVPILLVATEPDVRAAFSGGNLGRRLLVHDSVEDAITGLGEPPARRRADIELRPAPSSSRIARDFVNLVCRGWGLGDVTDGAAEVATELVENAIVHAATILRLRLELGDGGLAIAVRDGSPREAVVRERGGEPAIGLRLVADLARTWGCAPDAYGGKVVWAVLSVPRWSWAPA